MIGISQSALCCLIYYRIRLLLRGHHLTRFRLKHRRMHFFLISLATVLALWPFVQVLLGISLVNLDGETDVAPFEVLSLLLGSITWFSISYLLIIETKVYVKEFRWYTRFGVIYALLAEATFYRFIFNLRPFYNRVVFQICTTYFAIQVTFGMLSTFHLPELVPCSVYAPVSNEDAQDSISYELLPGKEQVFPERWTNVFSRMFFSWMSPLMKQGFKRPIIESDIWKLDSWDQSEELYNNFQRFWQRECAREKPSLLRALNKSLGARFWLGGMFKIGNDASQFVGPLMLNSLLQSMQRGDPSYIGYMYAASIFIGNMGGVLCEAQYFQNVFRVGFRTRATLVAAIFHKTLRLTQEGRKGFTSGRILNLMTSDAEALQQVSQQLHALWSAPIRIILCIYLLHKQLGYASFFGASVLLLLFPMQAFMINKMRKCTKEGLARTDKRIGLMSEILAAMDIVKCYAWEKSFRSKVLEIRKDELSWFRSAMTLGSINSFLLNSIPVLVTIIAFGLYSLTGGDLTPAKAFTSLALFSVLRFPLFMLPNLITQIANANVSLQRVQDFLLAEGRMLRPNPPLSEYHPAVYIRNGNFMWDKKAVQSTLSDINVEIPVGSLVAIVGGTGEGKTSLVSAILGEISSVGNSEVILRGRVAYVPQISWIFNGTVRSNILFGSPYDAFRYKRAIHVSGLDRDIELLPGGDLAEIGERGVNISGGQKQRVSIARAVYTDADVYIFDDPLSALDAHVAREVFELCIQEELQHKTRILVTNQLHFLSKVDNILLVQGGKIQEQGKYDELIERGPIFKQLMENAGKMEENSSAQNLDNDSNSIGHMRRRSNDEVGAVDVTVLSKDNEMKKRGKSRLVKLEERETGIVSWKVVERYGKALGGSWVVFIFFFCYIMVEAARASSSTWLSFWTDQTSVKTHGPLFYTGIYALFSFLQILTTLFNSLWLIRCSLSAAQRMHDGMLAAILRAPMSFFNSTPMGRVINRFAKDTGDIDRNIASSANMFLSSVFQLSSTFVMIGVINTVSLWAIWPLLILLHAIFLYYQSTAREIKRLDSISRSPVYAQFGEALNGLATIRAYKAYDRMAKVNGNTMDNSVRFTLVNVSSNRWLGIRLECLGGVMIWMTATFAVLANQRANQASFASQMGLLLTYALNITNLMTSTLRQASVGENSFNAVERVGAYTDLTPEAPLVVESFRPPSDWPSKGSIEFKNVMMRYRPDLPPVLHGLSAIIRPCEKIGVVGRTGAGKSSMFNTLFRIVEPESGQIFIDSFDICKFGLNDLRKSLSIIPQMPVLFSGTVRFNLDPFQEQNDAALWEALDRAHLKHVIKRSSLGLDAEVAENGENFSVGQRQLLSLARALVRRSKVLVLDEATAAVDVGTDALIQKTIREEFKSCTMLIIAHRLNTIIDCDRVLVLDAGRVKEMDAPKELLQNDQSMFYGMVQSTGSANAEYLRKIAFGKINLRAILEREEKENRKATAIQWASSQRELQAFADRQNGDGILRRASDAVRVLQGVLEGLHDDEIADELLRQDSSADGWWSAFLRVIQGFSLMEGVLSRVHLRDPLEEGTGCSDGWVELS